MNDSHSDRRGPDGPPGYNLRYHVDPLVEGAVERDLSKVMIGVRRANEPLGEGEMIVAAIGDVRLTRFPNNLARSSRGGAPALSEAPLVLGIDSVICAHEPRDHRSGVEGFESSLHGDYVPITTILRRMGAYAAGEVPSRHPVTVAVIDDKVSAADPEELYFPRGRAPRWTAGDHGDLMAMVVAAVAKASGVEVHLRRVRIPDERSAQPTDIAVAIAALARPSSRGAPAADVILLPLSSGRWGTPPHLDAVIQEAVRVGRGGKGMVIVCSSGRPSDNQTSSFSYQSAALGADEIAAHPDVIAVGPCNLAGEWLMRWGHRSFADRPGTTLAQPIIAGRMGPSIAVTAPGVPAEIDKGKTSDDSSLASALVAGVVAKVIGINPHLTASEVRRVLQETALAPSEVDPAGPESNVLSRFDRAGHNFKLGAGMVSVIDAALAASDPVCQTLLRSSPRRAPPSAEDMVMADPTLLLGGFLHRTIDRGQTPLQVAYRERRAELAAHLLRSPDLREEASWVARHLLAIFTSHRTNAWFTPFGGPPVDHGALLRRLIRLAERARVSLARDNTPAAAWAGAMKTALEGMSSADLERSLLRLLLGDKTS